MKHFLLEGQYTASFKEGELLSARRQFLQEGYDKGWLLLCGSTIPAKGEILVARADTLNALTEFLINEPYSKANVMRFKAIKQFDPLQHQFLLSDWFGKYSG